MLITCGSTKAPDPKPDDLKCRRVTFVYKINLATLSVKFVLLFLRFIGIPRYINYIVARPMQRILHCVYLRDKELYRETGRKMVSFVIQWLQF